MEALYLHTSVQPAEPQTRVKTGRNTFFLPDFQFIFNLTVLQPNNPLGITYYLYYYIAAKVLASK